jgi:hypothetical protein
MLEIIHPPIEASSEEIVTHFNLVESETGLPYDEVVRIIETTPLYKA